MRADDIIVRWGGEEFLAVLPQTRAVDAAALAERVRVAAETAPFVLPGGREIHVTVSIGIGEMRQGVPQFEEATRNADAALYRAKTSGRNRVCGGALVSPPASPIGCAA